MKNVKITICLFVWAISSVFAQEERETTFALSPESVKVYDFEASTKGMHYEYQFEDDYTVKLTNKAYMINLFFEEGQRETVQKVVSKVLDGNNNSSGFQTMVWKKTTQDGKPSYTIKIKNNKLRIEVARKNSDLESYKVLNYLGREFIKAING